MEPTKAAERRGLLSNVMRVWLIRIVINAVVLFGSYIGLQLGIVYAERLLPPAQHSLVIVIGFLALGPIMLPVYAMLVRIVEGRIAGEISISPLLALAGAILGGALFCAVYGALWAIGVARWAGWSHQSAIAIPLAIQIASAIGEELTFRGGIFRVLEDSFGTAVAIVISAIAFGFVHATNHGATYVSTAAIALEAGVLLGLAYAVARNLWFPIGLHFGWGFVEGGVFGAAVSGRSYQGLLNAPLSGSDILTGGAFGPEASLVAVAISLAASAVLLSIAVRTKRWKKITFRMLLD